MRLPPESGLARRTPLFNSGRMTYGNRSERVGLRLTPEEHAVVQQLTLETGMTASDVVRQAIRTAHRDRFNVPKRKPRKRRQ